MLKRSGSMRGDTGGAEYLKSRTGKTLAVFVLIWALLISMVLPQTAWAMVPSGRQLVASDFLKAEGGHLRNRNGEIVALRGVNAGGWLIQESWMCPINGADRAWANLDTLNTLKNRGFSDAQIQTLFDTYQNNWFTVTDLDNLKAMSVNVVRVPFWYRNFMKDEAGTWITGTDLNNNPGIKRLDWVISECGKRGMYVILDLHGAPGGQSMDHCSGTLGKNELYDSATNRAIMADLWTKIAARYKGNPVVAAYDIMNEPQNNGGYSGANAWAPGSPEALSRTYSVYDQMYRAIRAVDPDHAISMEAIWTGSCLPDPATYGWTNLLYQMHIYDTSTNMIDTRVNELKYFQSQYGTAVYAGEFNCDPNEDYAMQKFNQAGISWTTWAYKGSKQGVGNNWFLYVKNLPYADSTSDSYDTMLSKWGMVLNTSNFDTNTNTVRKWITDRVNDPIPNGSAAQIPGRIEAESYVSMSGVQTESCSEGGMDVGWIEAGDWMDYNVKVSSAGSYTVQYRVSSPNTTGQIQLRSGSTVLATTNVPSTGGWQNWQTVTVPVSLSAGTQTLRLYASGSGFNLNWIDFGTGTSQVATPSFNPQGGVYAAAQNVTLSCATSGATIRYTTNGSDPTSSSTQYTSPINVSSTTTIKAKAFKSGMADSAAASATYTIGTSTGIVPGQTYKIISRYSGKALDVANSSTADGGNVIQWTYSGSSSQKWKVVDAGGGYYNLVNVNSGKGLDVADRSTADGGNIQQWTLSGTGGTNQQWQIVSVDGYYRIVNRNSGKVVDVSGPSTADGANVHQWAYTGADNQLFSFLAP